MASYKVLGPPGTGKTRRLLNEVHKYVQKGTPSRSNWLLRFYS